MLLEYQRTKSMGIIINEKGIEVNPEKLKGSSKHAEPQNYEISLETN